MADWSPTWTFLDGDWHEGNVPVVGPRSHAFWLGSSVFDGARAFEGVMPDLDRHCERVNASALALGLTPTMTAEAIAGLAREGGRRFVGMPRSISARCTGRSRAATWPFRRTRLRRASF